MTKKPVTNPGQREIAIVRFTVIDQYDSYSEQLFVAQHITEWTSVDEETFQLLKKAELTQGAWKPRSPGELFRVYERTDRTDQFMPQTIEQYVAYQKKLDEHRASEEEAARKKRAERASKKAAKTLDAKRALLAQLQQELGDDAS